MDEMNRLAEIAIVAARAAGKVILSFYKHEVDISIKGDGSPLTIADKFSHETIVGLLTKTGIPIVSEEAKELSFHSNYYWLIDPLDGTKDFLAANDEFTINIALIKNDTPILGVLYAPALNELYLGIPGKCIWRELNGERADCIALPKFNQLRMAKSRFHDHPDADLFAKANRIEIYKPIGSALKFGRLAMGEIDVYPRFVGSSEWDTAAGQAILEAAGGTMIDFATLKPVCYSKPTRRNGTFIAFRGSYLYEDFVVI